MQKRTTYPALIVSISIALFCCLSALLGECVDRSFAAGWSVQSYSLNSDYFDISYSVASQKIH